MYGESFPIGFVATYGMRTSVSTTIIKPVVWASHVCLTSKVFHKVFQAQINTSPCHLPIPIPS
jgi:hypothetical protein